MSPGPGFALPALCLYDRCSQRLPGTPFVRLIKAGVVTVGAVVRVDDVKEGRRPPKIQETRLQDVTCSKLMIRPDSRQQLFTFSSWQTNFHTLPTSERCRSQLSRQPCDEGN